jgi:hypothetical protein
MGRDPQHATAGPSAEGGAALLWAMLFVVITSGMIVAHASHMAAVRRELDARYDRKSLAEAVVRSGADEAVGWFRGRAQQPVAAFAPVFDPFRDPPVLETEDPGLGLVREFEIRGNLWGRYEVRHEGARDISAERGLGAAGAAWEIAVQSFVYRVEDPTRAFDEAPNRVVAQAATRTELRSLALALPAISAISVQDPALVTIRANAVIDGGAHPGLVHGDGPTHDTVVGTGDPIDLAAVSPTPYSTSPDPAIDPAATILGSPDTLRFLSMAIEPTKVFRLRADEVARFADLVWVPGRDPLPDDVRGALILVPGDARLSGERIDGAVLFVDGDLSIGSGGIETQIVGMVFVTGAMKVEGHLDLRGAVSVMGELTLGDGTSPPAFVRYDRDVIDALRASLRQYRMRRGSMPFDG